VRACLRFFVCGLFFLQCLAILVKLDLKLCHTKKNQAERDPGAKADAPEVLLNFIRFLLRWHHEVAPIWVIFKNSRIFYSAFLRCIINSIIQLVWLKRRNVVVGFVDTGGASLTLWKIFNILLAIAAFFLHILLLKTVLKRGLALLSVSEAFLEGVQLRIIRL